jgi:hypothetical protein
MPKCIRCSCFLPPHFVERTDDNKENECIFCRRGTKEIRYGENNEKVATKEETIKEYDLYLKLVKEQNEVLRKTFRGEGDIPSNLILK